MTTTPLPDAWRVALGAVLLDRAKRVDVRYTPDGGWCVTADGRTLDVALDADRIDLAAAFG